MKTLTLLLLMCAGSVLAVDDTPANRKTEAERYLEAVPPKEMFDDIAQNMAKSLPESQRDEFVKLMTAQLDVTAVSKLMLDSMVKHFTADELKALADFYSSPVGRSAMKKMGPYMADVMPGLQEEIMRAQLKTSKK